MNKFESIDIHIREVIDFSGIYTGWIEYMGREIASGSAPTWQGVYDLLGKAIEDYERDERESNP